MIRTLLIIAGAGAVLCAAAVGGAVAIGGNDLARHGWAWTIKDDDGDTVRFERVDDDADRSPRVSRTLAWGGGDSLISELPGEVIFLQGDEAGVVVNGPQDIADRVRLIDGRLTLNDGPRDERVQFKWNRDGVRAWSDNDRLTVTVTAPSVKRFELQGSGDLSIRDYDQPTLDLAVRGSGSIDADGRARSTTVAIAGSGDADLETLETTDATVDVNGSGDVRVGPTGKATVRVAGSGDVALTRRPAQLDQRIDGSGDVTQE